MSEDLSPAAQAGLLLGACALVKRGDLVRVRVTGADRLDYLHRMLTQDLKQVAIGAATYGCLLTVKGRILGDMLVLRHEGEMSLDMPRAAQSAVLAPLERYVIADDVVFEEQMDLPRFTLIGPDAAELLRQAGLPCPAQGWCVAKGDLQVLRFDRRGLPHFELVGDVSGLGVPIVGSRAYEIARIHHDIPSFGAELGQDVLFNEAGLEEAVSWKKGCYPGQEPVVMAKHRGRPPRRLVKLSHDNSSVESGMGLLLEGKSVGHVTSAAPAVDRWPAAALAYVRHEHALPEQQFLLENGAVATVRTVSGEAPAEEEAS